MAQYPRCASIVLFIHTFPLKWTQTAAVPLYCGHCHCNSPFIVPVWTCVRVSLAHQHCALLSVTVRSCPLCERRDVDGGKWRGCCWWQIMGILTMEAGRDGGVDSRKGHYQHLQPGPVSFLLLAVSGWHCQLKFRISQMEHLCKFRRLFLYTLVVDYFMIAYYFKIMSNSASLSP